MKIGFIGLGIMGRPMAGHLQAAGHAIYSCANRTPMPDELREGGAVACATPADVAAEAECLILMLPDTLDVERVLFGANGVAQRLKPGTIVIDMSSIDPIATRDFAERIDALGSRRFPAVRWGRRMRRLPSCAGARRMCLRRSGRYWN